MDLDGFLIPLLSRSDRGNAMLSSMTFFFLPIVVIYSDVRVQHNAHQSV